MCEGTQGLFKEGKDCCLCQQQTHKSAYLYIYPGQWGFNDWSFGVMIGRVRVQALEPSGHFWALEQGFRAVCHGYLLQGRGIMGSDPNFLMPTSCEENNFTVLYVYMWEIKTNFLYFIHKPYLNGIRFKWRTEVIPSCSAATLTKHLRIFTPQMHIKQHMTVWLESSSSAHHLGSPLAPLLSCLIDRSWKKVVVITTWCCCPLMLLSSVSIPRMWQVLRQPSLRER